MASEVKVEVTKGKGDVVDYEVSGGSSGSISAGTKEFQIGAIGSMVCFLTLIRRAEGSVKIVAGKQALNVSIDSGKDKKVSRGSSLSLPSKAKRAVVRERV